MDQERGTQMARLMGQIMKPLRCQNWKQVHRNFLYLTQQEYQNREEQWGLICRQLTDAWVKYPEQVELLKQVDYLAMTMMGKDTRMVYQRCVMAITEKMLQLSLQAGTGQQQGRMGDEREVSMGQLWDCYVQLLRSYNYRCVSMELDETNWLICWLVMALLLEDCQIDPSSAIAQKYPQLVILLLDIQKSRALHPMIRNQLFHQLSLLFRIFISRIDRFISRDNGLISKTARFPQTNNCTLLMEIIKMQLLSEREGQEGVKLDCLMLLLTLLEATLRPSVNYNQVLQFAIHLGLFLGEPAKGRMLLYCGQLVAMTFHRNCHEVVKLCRTQKELKMLERVLKLYRQALEYVDKRLHKLDEEEIVYKRLVMGFCGLLRINSLETVLEETISWASGPVIRLIEYQHGWHQEEADQHQPMEKQEEEEQESGWEEEYYSKHAPGGFEDQEQVDTLVASMWSIKQQNVQIFQSIMANFDEKQSLMWMVELEKYGQGEENPDD